MRKRVAVIGGGVAGLAAAVRLRDRAPADTDIIVYEQSGALGGKLRTGELAGTTVERGAESFLVSAGGVILYKHVGPFDDNSVQKELLPAIEKGLGVAGG